jgi:hypothetical protein
MARGMWSGIYQGYKDVQEQKRYDQERQDKLDLLNRERQDKLFSMAASLAGSFSESGVLTPSDSKGGSGPSLSFYEQQLQQLGAPEEVILDLQGKGPEAMQLAIETYTGVYDPERGAPEDAWGRISESIIVEKQDLKTISVEDFMKKFGLDLSLYGEEEQALMRRALELKLNPPGRKPTVHSTTTYLPTATPKIGDVKEYQDAIAKTLKAAAQRSRTRESDEKKQAQWTAAERSLDAGDPSLVVDYLRSSGELDSFMQPLFDQYPQMKNIPLGIWEVVRPGAEVPVQQPQVVSPQPLQEDIEALRANPSLAEEFFRKFNLDPNIYLQPEGSQ